jgi:hypothetical protein
MRSGNDSLGLGQDGDEGLGNDSVDLVDRLGRVDLWCNRSAEVVIGRGSWTNVDDLVHGSVVLHDGHGSLDERLYMPHVTSVRSQTGGWKQ